VEQKDLTLDRNILVRAMGTAYHSDHHRYNCRYLCSQGTRW